MNFQNLEYFLVVAEELNITRAAEQLHISEQALSHHINKLEKELDTKLFYRSPRLTLTLGGKRLQAASREIRNIRHQLELELDDINHSYSGELRIGVSYTRGQAVLPALLPPFHAAHPRVVVALLEGSSQELQAGLAKGMIDLLIEYAPIQLETAEVVEIGKERMFLVVPRAFMDNKYGANADDMREKFRSGVDITEFSDMPFILLDKDDRVRRLVNRLFSHYGIRPRVWLETKNIQTAFALSMKGMGVTVYPELFLSSSSTLSLLNTPGSQPPVDCFPIQSEFTTQTIVIAYDKDKYLSNAASEFITEARKSLQSGILNSEKNDLV